ncbi:MAG: hypothetical protein KKE59_02540 [Proteobacteria bacterium]|nr:hypothetical protein [Pseudomonadota bacterium]
MAIDVKNGIIAFSILLAIYQYLKRTAGTARWADSRRSHHLQNVREQSHCCLRKPAACP